MSDALDRVEESFAKLKAVAKAGAGLSDFWRELRDTQGQREPRAIWLARPENAVSLTALVGRLNQFAREVEDILQEEKESKQTTEGD